MRMANIADFKNHISYYIKEVCAGDVVRICSRNVAVAEVVPIRSPGKNRTQLGCGQGSAIIAADLTDPVLDPAACESITLQ
jgi:prevent-host-death family protein